jgi:hypothetical protein
VASKKSCWRRFKRRNEDQRTERRRREKKGTREKSSKRKRKGVKKFREGYGGKGRRKRKSITRWRRELQRCKESWEGKNGDRGRDQNLKTYELKRV